ncbi:MAG: HAD family hydrolase [Spirochaetaceae bacterium]|nr:MAG: HAD family hydrolase [Spirochaetaceae bacterium]
MEIKALAFDLDGTLYPEYRLIIPSLGLGLLHPRLVYHFSKVRNEIRSIRPIRDFKETQAVLLAKRLGKSPGEMREKTDRLIYDKWISSISQIKPFHGIKNVLLEMKNRGYKLALLSDLPVETKLSKLGLDSLWDFAFSSEETGYLKPNPEPFMHLIRMLGTDPGSILYIGNNYEYDVVGAAGLGIKTALLSSARIKNSIADMQFKNPHELKSFLLSLPNVS